VPDCPDVESRASKQREMLEGSEEQMDRASQAKLKREKQFTTSGLMNAQQQKTRGLA